MNREEMFAELATLEEGFASGNYDYQAAWARILALVRELEGLDLEGPDEGEPTTVVPPEYNKPVPSKPNTGRRVFPTKPAGAAGGKPVKGVSAIGTPMPRNSGYRISPDGARTPFTDLIDAEVERTGRAYRDVAIELAARERELFEAHECFCLAVQTGDPAYARDQDPALIEAFTDYMAEQAAREVAVPKARVPELSFPEAVNERAMELVDRFDLTPDEAVARAKVEVFAVWDDVSQS